MGNDGFQESVFLPFLVLMTIWATSEGAELSAPGLTSEMFALIFTFTYKP